MSSRCFTMNVQQLVWCVLGSADDLAMETSKVDSPSPFKELRRRSVAGAGMKKISWSANCLMTSAVTSSSADEDSAESLNQQLQMKQSAKGDATPCWDSADGFQQKKQKREKLKRRRRGGVSAENHCSSADAIGQEDVAMEIISRREDSAGSNSSSSRELICISCCYASSRKIQSQ
ncbi:hypothetical protein F511_24546 [Dorcoceras hygrometricum]|uniref:Uncharacterized protein n=1 Tax=Dorcoceras hygrometricum TaxID=472368 RepID=A0A2Z7BQH2_9LAMI|nr:hypothetical protein F511_24546 [Dorcoceras hygrometricum]